MYEKFTRECRICLCEDNNKELISPCRCSGSIEFVHRECLNKWRKTIPYISLRDHTTRVNCCEICHTDYIFSSSLETKKLQCVYVTRDLLIMFLCMNLMGYIIGMIFTLGGEKNIIYFCKNMNGYLYAYLLGNIIFHFLIGIITIIISICKAYSGIDSYPFCFIYCGECQYNDSCCINDTGGEGDYLYCAVCLSFALFGLFINMCFIYYIAMRNSKIRQVSKIDNRIMLNNVNHIL